MKGLFCLFTRLCPLSSLYCYHPGEANSRSLNNKFPVVERIGATHKQKRLCFQLRPYGIVAREFIELLLYARFQHSKLNMFNGIREISDACLSTLSPQCLEINKSVSILMLFVANEAKYFFLWHCLWCSSIDHHISQKMRHFSSDFHSLYCSRFYNRLCHSAVAQSRRAISSRPQKREWRHMQLCYTENLCAVLLLLVWGLSLLPPLDFQPGWSLSCLFSWFESALVRASKSNLELCVAAAAAVVAMTRSDQVLLLLFTRCGKIQ